MVLHICFTMALVLGALAFADASALAATKLAVLIASASAGGVAFAVGYTCFPLDRFAAAAPITSERPGGDGPQ